MRKQYFFRASPSGLLAWDVDRLVALSAELPHRWVPLEQVRELDAPFEGDEEVLTWRGLAFHVRLIDEANLAYPIILAADGTVMDGMHRIAKALRLGLGKIEAVQFESDPVPDHIGLEVVSKLPEHDESTGQMKKSTVEFQPAFVAYGEPAEAQQPGVGAFNDPAPAIAAELPAILEVPAPAPQMRRDQVDAALPQALPDPRLS
jgi:hypothetical protein